jgi:hypothetical protein
MEFIDLSEANMTDEPSNHPAPSKSISRFHSDHDDKWTVKGYQRILGTKTSDSKTILPEPATGTDPMAIHPHRFIGNNRVHCPNFFIILDGNFLRHRRGLFPTIFSTFRGPADPLWEPGDR